MNKPIRKAVRCYLIKDNNVVATKYKQGNKEGYYDIPGGKIEEGELPEQTAIREMKEETGLDVKNLKYKGNMIIEYPNRIFDFDVFAFDPRIALPCNEIRAVSAASDVAVRARTVLRAFAFARFVTSCLRDITLRVCVFTRGCATFARFITVRDVTARFAFTAPAFTRPFSAARTTFAD